LIDTVSFLHGRGVLHRDIKPDNIIISGAKLHDEGGDEWSDDAGADDAAKCETWKIRLIDFGFARPLHPDDIDGYKHSVEMKPEPCDDTFRRMNIDNAIEDAAIAKNELDLSGSRHSISHKRIRGLSAVGHRNYAAPEMFKGIRSFSKNVLSLSSHGKKEGLKMQHEQALAEAISDYGMTADAYSIGRTIRYMLTGVSPDISITEFIDKKNSVANIIGRKMKNKFSKKGSVVIKKRYKSTSELPKEASKVVLGLTHWIERDRTTVRSARNFEWIQSSYYMKNEKDHPSSNDHKGEINFLECALERRV